MTQSQKENTKKYLRTEIIAIFSLLVEHFNVLPVHILVISTYFFKFHFLLLKLNHIPITKTFLDN